MWHKPSAIGCQAVARHVRCNGELHGRHAQPHNCSVKVFPRLLLQRIPVAPPWNDLWRRRRRRGACSESRGCSAPEGCSAALVDASTTEAWDRDGLDSTGRARERVAAAELEVGIEAVCDAIMITPSAVGTLAALTAGTGTGTANGSLLTTRAAVARSTARFLHGTCRAEGCIDVCKPWWRSATNVLVRVGNAKRLDLPVLYVRCHLGVESLQQLQRLMAAARPVLHATTRRQSLAQRARLATKAQRHEYGMCAWCPHQLACGGHFQNSRMWSLQNRCCSRCWYGRHLWLLVTTSTRACADLGANHAIVIDGGRA